MDTERFNKLWQDTANSVLHEIRILVHNGDRELVRKVNNYYSNNIIKKLWFSTTLVCDYNEFMSDLCAENEAKYTEVKNYLFSNFTLITEDEESKLVSSILMSGGLGSALLGACRKNAKLLILSLGVTTLAYFYNRFNQGKIIEQANSIVKKKLLTIGKEVERILQE